MDAVAQAKLYEKLAARNNPFATYNHISAVEIGEEYAVTQLEIYPESLNPLGVVHGGCLYTLADNACGMAVHGDGRRHVTQNGNLHFVSNQGEGVLRATAKVVRRGKTTSLIRVEITGDNQRLIAVGDFSFYCISKDKV
ncbi:PaaI family thioesterase [Bengtsoniella intestinalis]|uniref:PaaI family thioesterase n=1 Tax=Bengtsoniella intestinalis TaxID=3073143 RepID=UPI00391F7169